MRDVSHNFSFLFVLIPKNRKRFTSHDSELPSLLSGNEIHWKKFTELTMHWSSESPAPISADDVDLISSMNKKHPELIKFAPNILTATEILNSDFMNSDWCMVTKAKFAVRFAGVDKTKNFKRRIERNKMIDQWLKLYNAKCKSGRPVMFTFYDMSKAETVDIWKASNEINDWKTVWRKAGWEPFVLTLIDAIRHPDYTEVRSQLLQTKLSIHNQMCYFRWLAIAAAGG